MEATMNGDLALLHQKIDYLTEQLEAQRRRQESIDELKQDLVPIANHMVKLTIHELDEIGNDFEMEDLLFLVKRLLRDTRMLIGLMDRLEAMVGLADEMELLGKQVFNNMVEELDRLERAGYFAFARQGWLMMERIVTEFDEEDARALADNIVTILKTVRNMTQPDILALANNAVDAVRDTPEWEKDPSAWQLMRELSDPKVRRGMSRMLNMFRALADQTDGALIN